MTKPADASSYGRRLMQKPGGMAAGDAAPGKACGSRAPARTKSTPGCHVSGYCITAPQMREAPPGCAQALRPTALPHGPVPAGAAPPRAHTKGERSSAQPARSFLRGVAQGEVFLGRVPRGNYPTSPRHQKGNLSLGESTRGGGGGGSATPPPSCDTRGDGGSPPRGRAQRSGRVWGLRSVPPCSPRPLLASATAGASPVPPGGAVTARGHRAAATGAGVAVGGALTQQRGGLGARPRQQRKRRRRRRGLGSGSRPRVGVCRRRLSRQRLRGVGGGRAARRRLGVARRPQGAARQVVEQRGREVQGTEGDEEAAGPLQRGAGQRRLLHAEALCRPPRAAPRRRRAPGERGGGAGGSARTRAAPQHPVPPAASARNGGEGLAARGWAAERGGGLARRRRAARGIPLSAVGSSRRCPLGGVPLPGGCPRSPARLVDALRWEPWWSASRPWPCCPPVLRMEAGRTRPRRHTHTRASGSAAGTAGDTRVVYQGNK